MYCSRHRDDMGPHSCSFTDVCVIQTLCESGSLRVHDEDSDGSRVTEEDWITMVMCLHSQADISSTLNSSQVSQHCHLPCDSVNGKQVESSTDDAVRNLPGVSQVRVYSTDTQNWVTHISTVDDRTLIGDRCELRRIVIHVMDCHSDR